MLAFPSAIFDAAVELTGCCGMSFAVWLGSSLSCLEGTLWINILFKSVCQVSGRRLTGRSSDKLQVGKCCR